MVYKHENHSRDPQKTVDAVQKLQVLLKLIRDADGKPQIAQRVGVIIAEVTVKGSWAGPARLHLIPHVNAPVADLPVRKVLGGLHFIADLTLPGGRVLLDYMKS
jgi:acetoacetate decarboxylase